MSRTALTKRVVDLRLWGDNPFFLLDVGCGGGLDSIWEVFSGRLRAVGFDPRVAEVERLRSATRDPGITYEAAFVGCRDYDALFPPALRNDRAQSKNNDPFHRVSAFAAQFRAASNAQESVNASAGMLLTERRVFLDEYVIPDERSSVDFIKVDTDGHDMEVLLGAAGIFSAGGALGVRIEAQLHGSTHDVANTFANIDRLLRRSGFTLFDLKTNRYSRAALPAQFVLTFPAQTESGQALWAEALYLRDLADPEYERMWPCCAITPERVMKLACLFELYRLRDCSAELLLNRGGFLAEQTRATLLDDLVTGEAGSYAKRMQRWQEDLASFYVRQSLKEGPKLRRLRARVLMLKHKNETLREKLQRCNGRLLRLAGRLEEFRSKRH